MQVVVLYSSLPVSSAFLQKANWLSFALIRLECLKLLYTPTTLTVYVGSLYSVFALFFTRAELNI